MSVIVSTETRRQLEFDEVISRIFPNLKTKKGHSELLHVTFFSDPTVIIHSATQVFESYSYLISGGSFPIGEWIDLSCIESSWKIPNKTISKEDLLSLYYLLALHQRLYILFSDQQRYFPLLHKLICSQPILIELIKIYQGIFSETGDILDHASDQLFNIRKRIYSLKENIRQKSEYILKSFQQEIHQSIQYTIRDGRWVLPVPADLKRKIKGNILDISGTGQTFFIEPTELGELNNHLYELLSDEKLEIHKILTQLSEQIREYSDEIIAINHLIVELDLIQAKANFLKPFSISIPEIIKEKKWVIHQAIHPILFLTKNEKHLPISPLNLELGGKEERFILVTGPNAGGKSVLMKSLGLMQLLFQYGLPIPVKDGSLFPIVGGIFSIIGDNQSIQQDLSSFSGHLHAIWEMMNAAPFGDSLILIDEICNGTDPSEGQALAKAFIQTFIACQFSGIITSHYSALKSFAHEHPTITNGSMTFDVEQLKPTYEFRKGVPGSSFALEVAQRLGVSRQIIQEAKSFIQTEHAIQESLNLELERLVSGYHRQVGEVEELKKELLKQQGELNKKEKEVRLIEKNTRQSLKKEYQHKFDQLRQQIFMDFEKIKVEKNVNYQKEKQRLFQKVQSVQKVEEAKEVFQFNVGQIVQLKDGSEVGEILTLERDFATIQFGQVKLKVVLSELEPSKKTKIPTPKISVKPTFNEPVNRELKLLGLKVDEALQLVEIFLSEASSKNYPSVRIVHGKGTGALRKAIHNYLAHDLSVESYSIGEWNEGSSGVTIVKLKT